MTQEGGTSESSPLTAGAAADVISAYRATHAGHSPTPGLVKSILLSTASDIGAPAEQQGAGILNVGAAINLATTINHGSKPNAKHELTFSTNQINIQGTANSSSRRKIFITNNGKKPAKVESISTRTLAKKVATSKGTACLNPTSGTIACGPPTATTFLRENGATQVYVEKKFTVPSAGKNSRLNFSAALPNQDTNYSVLKVALYAPNGAYAGYSIPQGVSNYANIQVTNPQAGKWTAVFFDTQHDDAEQGTVKWEADTWKSGDGGTISPTKLTIAPGHTMSAKYKVKLPATPGDTSQSIVVKSGSNTNTIPVTIRTLAKPSTTFPGVLTGGNGRGNPAVQSTYAIKVPAGKADIDAQVIFADINVGVVAFLQDPQGNNVAQSSNLFVSISGPETLSNTVTVIKDHPQAGTWTLVLDWLQPVSGSAINTPFVGRFDFNKVKVSSNLPSGATIPQSTATNYAVHYTNKTPAPQLIFLDPRQSTSAWVDLADLAENPEPFPLPTPLNSTPPIYMVPQDSSKLDASLDATAPVSFDFSPWTGDPDLYASGGMNPTYTYTPSGGEVTPGFWDHLPERGRAVRPLRCRHGRDGHRRPPGDDARVRSDGQHRYGRPLELFQRLQRRLGASRGRPRRHRHDQSVDRADRRGRRDGDRHDQRRLRLSVQPVPRLGRRRRRRPARQDPVQLHGRVVRTTHQRTNRTEEGPPPGGPSSCPDTSHRCASRYSAASPQRFEGLRAKEKGRPEAALLVTTECCGA